MQMRQPWIKFGTDAGGMDPDSARALAHPRTYGTFTRILGHYVRGEQLLPLEEAVRKMTSQAATRVGLLDRGVLRPGFFADITVFDPATVKDEATFADPHRHPAGLPYVIVNGHVVVDGPRFTAAPAGRVLPP